MSEHDWIGSVIAAARPQAMAALLRNFRELDAAEEAFQEACLRALKAWPKNGPPRDAAAWLIMVAKNAGIDTVRRQSRLQPLHAMLFVEPSPMPVKWALHHMGRIGSGIRLPLVPFPEARRPALAKLLSEVLAATPVGAVA